MNSSAMKTSTPTRTYLSKSDFKLAQNCPTKLFYKKSRYPSEKDEDEYLQLLAEGGFIVERIAKLLFPEGRELEFTGGSEESARQTMRALKAGDGTFFEATLISGSKLARIDILKKRGNELDLIEVKATSYNSDDNAAAVQEGRPNLFRTKRDHSIISDWREYLEDVTFQVLVLRELFPRAIIRAFLMMPDTAKTTSIDRLYSLFELRRVRPPGATFEHLTVEFHGDAEQLRTDHFLTQVPVDAEIELLSAEVRDRAQVYSASLVPQLTKIPTPISTACRDCEYRRTATDPRDGFNDCWGPLADVRPHLFDLYQIGSLGGRGGPVANRLIADRSVNLLDLPESSLVKSDGTVGEHNKRQLLQIRHTRANTEWFSDELPAILERFPYPLHFIDFETTALAVPYHAGMRPYEPVAFQWSCHTLERPGARVKHSEWINVDEAFPNFEFAESLMAQLGTTGTVFMWATHEYTILRRILTQMQERVHHNFALAQWLENIVRQPGQDGGRLTDMNRLSLQHYFHPLMKGRTSIKVVCDAIWKSNSGLRAEFPEYLKEVNGTVLSPYAALPPLEINGQPVVVAEGTGAIRAYEAMLYGIERDDPDLRLRWKNLLLQYCKLDTAAMVLVWRHWSSHRP